MAGKVWATKSTRPRLCSQRWLSLSPLPLPLLVFLSGFSGLGLCVKYTHRGGLEAPLAAAAAAAAVEAVCPRCGSTWILQFVRLLCDDVVVVLVVVIVIITIIIINSSSSCCCRRLLCVRSPVVVVFAAALET